MISIGSGLVWNGLLKAFGGLPGPILSVFFDFPNNYFFNRPPRGLFLTVFNHYQTDESGACMHFLHMKALTWLRKQILLDGGRLRGVSLRR